MKHAAPNLKTDTDLGNIVQLSRYMNCSDNYLYLVKKGASLRAAANPANPSCFTGNKSCKQWIMEWLTRNRDFKTTEAYPRQSLQHTA
jgi:hypothetical protein